MIWIKYNMHAEVSLWFLCDYCTKYLHVHVVSKNYCWQALFSLKPLMRNTKAFLWNAHKYCWYFRSTYELKYIIQNYLSPVCLLLLYYVLEVYAMISDLLVQPVSDFTGLMANYQMHCGIFMNLCIKINAETTQINQLKYNIP